MFLKSSCRAHSPARLLERKFYQHCMPYYAFLLLTAYYWSDKTAQGCPFEIAYIDPYKPFENNARMAYITYSKNGAIFGYGSMITLIPELKLGKMSYYWEISVWKISFYWMWLVLIESVLIIIFHFIFHTHIVFHHGVIILNRSNNSQISIETSAPQQAGGFIIKCYFGISNITACR